MEMRVWGGVILVLQGTLLRLLLVATACAL